MDDQSKITTPAPQASITWYSLPYEIRYKIWKYCLPRRVVEVDVAFVMGQSKGPPEALLPKRMCFLGTSKRSTALPVITQVCHESRQLALKYGEFHHFEDKVPGRQASQTQGGSGDGDGDGSSSSSSSSQEFDRARGPIWIQPKLDVIRLNWGGQDISESWNLSEAVLRVRGFLALAKELDMDASVSDALVYNFDKLLLDARRSEMASRDPSVHTSAELHGDLLGVELSGLARQNQNRRSSDTALFKEPPAPNPVSIFPIILHLSDRDATESGLFGHLGDECVQLVDWNDFDKLAKFRELYETKIGDKDPAPRVWFDHIFSERFSTLVKDWLKAVEFVHICSRMPDYQHLRVSGATADTTGTWDPDAQSLSSATHWGSTVGNRNRPWTRENRPKIPVITPQVVIRHCSQDCSWQREE